MELQKGADAIQCFFLALAHHKLGDDKARQWYDRGVEWLDQNRVRMTKDQQSPFDELRTEAEQVLGPEKD